MISTETAREIAEKNQSLIEAQHCLENIEKCTAGLMINVLTENALEEDTQEAVYFDDIKDHDLECILEAVIDNLLSRLDELNALAAKEAQG